MSFKRREKLIQAYMHFYVILSTIPSILVSVMAQVLGHCAVCGAGASQSLVRSRAGDVWVVCSSVAPIAHCVGPLHLVTGNTNDTLPSPPAQAPPDPRNICQAAFNEILNIVANKRYTRLISRYIEKRSNFTFIKLSINSLSLAGVCEQFTNQTEPIINLGFIQLIRNS